MTDTLSIRDNRTGREYEVAITDGTIRAADLKQIAVDGEPGLATYDPGFVNTASCRSAITYIDGDVGILEYRGYPIEQLAEHSTFLEVAYLLLNGELPTQTQLDEWVHEHHLPHVHPREPQAVHRGLPLRRPPDGHADGVGQRAVDLLPRRQQRSATRTNRKLQITRLIAKMPTLGAFAYRHQQGKPYVYPDNALSYTANFLAMLFKMSEPSYAADPRLVKALEVLFILHADHEQNCSTNAVRSVGSSQVDPYSAVAAGIGALYGPLHGGANEAVLAMLQRIKTTDNIPDFIAGVKEGKEKLMGFGHRVYKNYDPRAKIIKKACDDVFEVTGVNPLLKIAMELEKIALEDEYFVKRQALPQRRLLLRADLRGAAVPAGDVHRAVRHRPDPGLARPVVGAGAGQGAEDRPAQADLHRLPDPRLRPHGPALT